MTRSRTRIFVVAAIAFSAWMTPPDAAGQTPADEAKAKEHFQRGERLVREGDHAAAMREFLAGYALSKRPLFLFNIAECARLGGDLAKARAFYEEYIRKDPKGRFVAQARQRLAELSGGTGAQAGQPGGGPNAAGQPRGGAGTSGGARGSAEGAVPAAGAGSGAPANDGAHAAAQAGRRDGPAPSAGQHFDPRAAVPAAVAQAPTAPQPLVPATRDHEPKKRMRTWPIWVGVGAAVVASIVTVSVVYGTRDRGPGGGDYVVDLRR